MLIDNEFTVAQPVEKVWEFFGNIPQVAQCLPGARLDEELGEDSYKGKVGVSMGPVKMQFDGLAKVLQRDEATKTMVIDGAGSDEKGRGNATLLLTAKLAPAAQGTKVSMQQDIQLSGAAAQYGRGMISDVSAVLMAQFATNMQARIAAIESGADLSTLGAAKSASGFAIGLQALRMALMRVARRFFAPYQPTAR
ncbi:MAG: SRPBCC family protein [Nocardioides sp.]